jgi:hypothetical protein
MRDLSLSADSFRGGAVTELLDARRATRYDGKTV